MRPFVYRVARAEGVAGRVWNDGGGVTIEAFGDGPAISRFLARLRQERPPAAGFDEVACQPITAEALDDFRIVESEAPGASEPRVSIPADLATCGDCLAELRDPANRRYRYPFTNCTNCGPRFTIARGVPYDRPLTTMAPFVLCADCRREYEDPCDRRFHAEPNACPACGPHVILYEGAAQRLASPSCSPLAPEEPHPAPPPFAMRVVAERDAAVVAAGRALAEGRIVAVKGIGGFHLACDALSSAAVKRLRERKRREEKPLAVMPRDLAEAEALAELSDAERALLASVERPIVLARQRARSGLAPEIAPDTPLIGLLLPYSPLHHLLLAEAGRPLVMTSGNLSEEPIALANEEAISRLSGIADLFLVHDREIETRADDSVAKVVVGRPLVLRRSRGYAPRGVRVRGSFARPTLACGAHLKNTFCLGLSDAAYLGPHIGDLENLATLQSLEGAVASLERFLRTRPELLAHDLHPEYLSTQYALDRARDEGIPAVGVQHHHAHAAAAMAEHGLPGPAFALAWDGTGLGDDGTPWGGELLLATYESYERLATFRPIALAGGDSAIREPWRIALAALDDAFAGAAALDAFPLFRAVDAAHVRVVRQMIAQGFNAPRAHGAGRAFDAVGALALARPRARYEGQVAMALDAAADSQERASYPFHIETGVKPWQLDLRPLVRAVATDVSAGRAPATISARFHNALVLAACELVRLAAARHGQHPVVLTGGCFANARLAEGISQGLSTSFQVYLHGFVPPGDGGLALGQAIVADARSRGA